MDENSRAGHRFRPRPYDLRRKVLLKNFLREQMTYIPPLRGSSVTSFEADSHSNLSGDLASTVGNEENIESPKSDHEYALPASTNPNPQQIPSSSSVDERSTEVSPPNDSVAPTGADTVPPSKFSLVSSLLKFKGSSRKKRKKGISKAKHVCKNAKNSNKSIALHTQNRIKLELDKVPKEKRSFFSLFKSRKDKRNKTKIPDNSNERAAPTSADTVKTTTQSVQTDISWSNAEYNELERSHKCLQEENRLLSESLSFIMDFKTRPEKETSVCTDSYCRTEPKPPTTQEVPTTSDRNAFNREPSEGISKKSKLLRSKSVQEKCNVSKVCLRTRSMNLPGTSKMSSISPVHSSGDSLSNRSRFPPASSSAYRHSSSRQLRPSVLKNLPINSSRMIIRRSSMPERTSHEPVRPLLRQRSHSIRAYNQSADTYRNPNSSPYSSSRPSGLKSLPINNFGKSIVRRSSMPERMPQSHYRPVYRHHSVNYRDYRNVPNKYSNRYRLAGNCHRSVPFQNLPNEAFY